MEFKFDLLEKENVGTIELEDKVRVSDPCYDVDTWCAGTLENVLQGKYQCYSQDVDAGDWGIRVASIEVRHEDYLDVEPTELQDIDVGVDSGQAGIYDLNYFIKAREDKDGEDAWYKRVCDLTFGYFDNPNYIPFNKSIFWEDDFEEAELVTKKLTQELALKYIKAKNKYRDSIVSKEMIGKFISSTLDNKCLVSSSGDGDGSYHCFVGRNENGKIVSIKIDYYYGYDEDDEYDEE